jgi:hypothetical protein
MSYAHRSVAIVLLLGGVALSDGTRVETAKYKPSHILNVNTLQTILKQGMFKKSGFIPPICSNVKDGALLECWLTQYPTIADSIEWQGHNRRVVGLDLISWPDWPQWRRADLEEAFVDATVWYNGGMKIYTGTLVADPPPNMEEPYGGGHTVLDETTAAWPLYVAHVAHSLAAEIYGWVPWSLRDYDSEALRRLFSTHLNMFNYDSNTGDFYDVNYPGYVLLSSVTPSHPTFVFKFLKENNLIGATPVQTIGNLLEWSRVNLAHIYGSFTNDNYLQYWQYWGKPPVRRIIEGTFMTDPNYPAENKVLKHWTAGCYGTTDFFVWVLRTVNIPTRRRSSEATCSHAMPHFMEQNLYLSHGDDPYGDFSEANFPATYLLVNAQTWKSWFETGDQQTSCDNVGRRPVELSVWYLSDAIVGRYCADVLNGKDHASGQVYEVYSKYYTVAQLEATDLWGRLAAAVSTSTAWQCNGL